MDRWVDGWMDGWVDGCVCGRVDRWVYRRMWIDNCCITLRKSFPRKWIFSRVFFGRIGENKRHAVCMSEYMSFLCSYKRAEAYRNPYTYTMSLRLPMTLTLMQIPKIILRLKLTLVLQQAQLAVHWS